MLLRWSSVLRQLSFSTAKEFKSLICCLILYSEDIDTNCINVPTRASLAGERKCSFVRWLVNLNVKRNLTEGL